MNQKKSLKSAMSPRAQAGTPVADTFATGREQTTQTTVRLPSDLHMKARYYSLERGVSLNQLIVEGLAQRLEQ